MLSTYLLLIVCLFILLTSLIPQYVLDWQIQFRVEALKDASYEIGNRIDYYLGFYDSTIYVTYIDNITRQYANQMDSRVLIFDNGGKIISDSNNQLKSQTLEVLEINEALTGEMSWNNYYFNDIGNVLYLAIPVFVEGDVRGGVLVSNSINDLYDHVEIINRTIQTIMLTIGLIIILGVFIISNHFLRPINKFYPVINKLAKGDFSDRVVVKSNDEFKLLADSFNNMSVQLNEVEQQREDFVGNVSHELKTPLSSIKLLSESLLTQDKVEESVYKEFLMDINNEVNRLNRIVTDLLSLVDMNKKDLILSYQFSGLTELVRKVAEQLKPLADQKQIVVLIKEKEKLFLRMDPDKIKQAVINILHNAIMYTAEQGSIEVSLYKEKEMAVIEIKDTGVGISEENLQTIFNRFYRVDRARSRNTGGTGLGLSISKQIVNLHHGELTVRSKLGEGSIFCIKLPIQ